jgi:hypothetical protein
MAGPWEDFAAPQNVESDSAPPWADFAPQEQPPATTKDRVQALNSGFSRGLSMVAGIPADTGANIFDLIKAGIGTVYQASTGKAAPSALDPVDRNKVVGSSQYIAGLLNKAKIDTQPLRPDDTASRYLYAGGAAIPAVALNRPETAVQGLLQAGQAAAIGMVPQAVSDMGGGTGAQTAATLGASILLPAAIGTVRGLKASAQPLSETGRRQIAGAAIRSAATNADDAMQNMDDAVPLVPGSQPTAAQAARDPGIAFFENRLRALNQAGFSTRMSAQNEARQKLLDTVARGGDDVAISAMESRREAITTALRDQAMREASGKRVPTENVLKDIDNLLANPENAGQSVQSALRAVRSQIGGKDVSVAATDGYKVSGSSPVVDARALYAVRKEINRLLEGKYVGADEHVLRYAGGQLAQVRRSIDDAITEVAPSWKPYLNKYAQLSKPIERAQEIGSIRQSTSLSAPDVATGRDFISQPKWRNVVGKNMPELSKLLTKGQTQKMQMVAADLDRGAAATSSASIRVPGSDTAANLATQGQLSVANIIGRTLGKDVKELPPALATITRPLSFVYKLPDDQVRRLIVDAMLDPKLASQLMREGTKANIQTLADSFRKQAELSGIIIASEVADARRRLGVNE